MTPLVRSRSMCAEVLAEVPNDTKLACDWSNMALEKESITIRGSTVKAGLEPSPSRRKALRGFSEARNLAHGLNESYACTECSRSHELFDTNGCARIGNYGRGHEEWVWDYTVAVTVGVRLPRDMPRGEEAVVQQEEGAEANVEMQNQAGDGMEANDEPSGEEATNAEEELSIGATKQRALARSSMQ